MVTPRARVIALRRAVAGRDAVAAVLVTLLVVCALVSGLVAALGPLQQQAMHASLRQMPPGDTVVEVVSGYDRETASRQDRAVRQALRSVLAPADGGRIGGTVVRVAETVAFDRAGGGRAWPFAAVSGAQAGEPGRAGVVSAAQGRLPETAPDGPVEVAVPARAGEAAPSIGEPITLVSRLDGTRVSAVVVGSWERAAGAGRALGRMADGALLVADETFHDLAQRASSVRWRAAPQIDRLRPGQLDALGAAAAGLEAEVAALGEDLSSHMRVENPLTDVVQRLSRELLVQRTLLLAPATVLLLLGAASALLIASALSQARRVEEGLLRSRGAGRVQLVGPAALEIATLCAVAAALGPLLAAAVVRVGEVRPQLDANAWFVSVGAAGVCGLALLLPTVVRAFSGDSGEQQSESRRRRRSLTLMISAGLVVAAVGLAALAGLQGFAAGLAARADQGGTDPLVVVSPALLLLAVVAALAVVVLPLLFRLSPRAVRTKGVALALAMRFTSRAPVKTVPLALVVALTAGGAVLAATERVGQGAAREARAAYEVGADVRVVPPADHVRPGERVEQEMLSRLRGVEAVAGVARELDFVGDVAVEVVAADLAVGPIARALLTGADEPEQTLRRLHEPEPSRKGFPVAVTDRLAEQAGLVVGDRIELPVNGIPLTLEVVETLAYLPTVADDRAGLLVDAALMLPLSGSPDEWWLDVDEGQVGAVTAQLSARPELASQMLTRARAARRLASNARTGGTAYDDILTVTAAGSLLIGGVLLFSVVLLRRRERMEQAELLRILGASGPDVTRTLGAEYSVTAGAGALVGVAAGLLVGWVTLTEMAIGPSGGPLVPAPELLIPWSWLAATPVVLVLLPMVALLVLARPDRRRHAGRSPGAPA